MAQMIRKQIYIDADNERYLKERSKELGITEAEVVRQALAMAAEQAGADRRLEALDSVLSYVCKHRMRDVPQTGQWKFNREELYEERMEELARRREANAAQAL